MPKKPIWQPSTRPSSRGFQHTAALVSKAVSGVSGTRGFAEARLLTQWTEICGESLAAVVQPLKISYGRGGMGATLTVSCEGARASEVQMQADLIRSRVNACYGYNAISRVRIAQTDASGFAERAAHFETEAAPPRPEPRLGPEERQTIEAVESPALREALATLGRNVLSRQDKDRKG